MGSTYQLPSSTTHNNIIIIVTVVIVAIVVLLFLCCCCLYRYCCRKKTGYRKHYYQPASTPRHLQQHYSRLVTLESGEHTQSESDEENTAPLIRGGADYPDSASRSIVEKRSLASLPDNFDGFINKTIIPFFKDQRATRYQFAVLLLLSEDNLKDITKTIFTPTDYLGRPFVNKDHPSMPNDSASYGNYIVARPVENSYHSEEEIFGKYSSTNIPFIELWNSYIRYNGTSPKCILLYSWNLPCSRCTNVIIRSLEEHRFSTTCVIVVHTTYWKSETQTDYNQNIEKLRKSNISVEHVNNPERLSPA